MSNYEQQLIDEYFNDPAVKKLLNKELGLNGKITVDWENRIVRAIGSKAGREWDLDEMLEAMGT